LHPGGNAEPRRRGLRSRNSALQPALATGTPPETTPRVERDEGKYAHGPDPRG